MLVEVLTFILTSLIAYFICTYKSVHYHLDKHGIKYLPGVPLFGNILQSTLEKRHFLFDMIEVYKAFPEEKYVGFLDNTSPTILVRDPELIKNITVKDFDHFVDHKDFFPEENNSLFSNSAFLLKGDRWRKMRTTISPAFTASKVKLVMPVMEQITNNIMEYLKENETEEINLLDLFRRYANDVIVWGGLGLEINSLKDKNNEFFLIGRSIFYFTPKQKAIYLFLALFPDFMKKIGIQFFPQKSRDFFKNAVSSIIEYRKKNNVERPDVIQILMESPKDWSVDHITDQVVDLFIAGYDTVATALTVCAHELAINPDVQEKMYQEIKEFKEKKGNPTYDNITDLKYMDCVLNESFRKCATAMYMDRTCTKAYELPPSREGGMPYRLKPGDVVYNMVNALHMDPKYYPDPERFDPERFSDENKHNIKPGTFMPFGIGPRICVGLRFGMLEIRVLMYYLILNFKIVQTPNTTDRIILNPSSFNLKPNGSYVRFSARN